MRSWFGAIGACIVSAALWTAPAAAQEDFRTVTLDEAIELALDADPAAVAASGGVSAARASVLEARGAWLPTLDANSAYGNSSNQRVDQATGRVVSERYTASLSASYNLFDGGRRIAGQRSAGADLRAAEAGFRAQTFQTVLATTQSFYEAAASDELVAVARQRLERARQQLVFAETRLDVGTATRSDLLRAEIEVSNAELAVVEAETALRAARLELGRQTGVGEEVRPASATLPERAPALPEPAVLAERAERFAPAAAASRASLSASRAATRATYAGYLPTIRASGGYDWFAFEFPPREQSWSLNVFASFPLFNGFSREAAVARARAAERSAEVRARDATIGARIAAENAAREVQSSERRAAIAERTIELAREDLRVQEERYRIGATTILELQASQVALSDAQVAAIRARQELGVALAQLEAVLGERLGED